MRRLVLRDTLTLVLIGVAIGLPVALAVARLLSSQLYEVGPTDPPAIALALTTLSLTASSQVTSRRGARLASIR